MGKGKKKAKEAEPPPPPPPPRIIRLFYLVNGAKSAVAFDANGGFAALFDAAEVKLEWRPQSVFKDNELVTQLDALSDLDTVLFKKEKVTGSGQALSPFLKERTERVVGYLSRYAGMQEAEKLAAQQGAA